jgi:hypothetical protein
MHLDGLLPPDRHLQPLQKSILLQISLKGLCQVKQILILSAIDPWAIRSHNRQQQKGFVGCLIGGQFKPLFTVFVSPQAGKAFEVFGKRHSISRLLKCLQFFRRLPFQAIA